MTMFDERFEFNNLCEPDYIVEINKYNCQCCDKTNCEHWHEYNDVIFED